MQRRRGDIYVKCFTGAERKYIKDDYLSSCVFIGAGRGLVYGIFSVVKNIVIIAVAIGMAPVIAKQLPSEVAVKDGAGYVVAFVISIIVFNIIGSFIKGVRDVPLIGGLDRFGGAVAGLIVGFFISWSILAVLGSLQEYESCREIVQSAKEDKIVMWFQSCSPLPAVMESLGFNVL